MLHVTRRQVLGAVGVGIASLAGCGSRARSTGGDAAQAADSVPTADQRLPLPLDPEALRREALSGGPGRDGIPSIDDPVFTTAADIDFLDQGDPVFGVAVNGEVKAYPQSILAHHEIVNDTFGDLPVAVTYCPLTGTAMGFDRGETTFGVSGRLLNNNLIMYDRASETWWPQILATAIPGPWNPDPSIESLREVRAIWTTVERWTTRYPQTQVLTRETGHVRNYNRDPYGEYNPVRGYYGSQNTIFPRLNPNDRFHPKEVFIGARTTDGAVAFSKSALASAGLLTGSLGDRPVLAAYDTDLATGYVYRNPEERSFSFVEGVVQAADGTTHDPDTLPLDRIHAFDAMWFAWSGFYPETSVYD